MRQSERSGRAVQAVHEGALMSLRSWTYKGCINTEMRITRTGLAEYCRFSDGRRTWNRTQWRGDEIVCLDKQTKGGEHDQDRDAGE